MALRQRSDAFGDGEQLPARYSRGGGNVAPPFDWDGVPAGAAELVLLAEDEDALGSDGRPFLHWVLAGVPADFDGLGEGDEPEEARTGSNSLGEFGYVGPEPPEGETHRYTFSLVAVSCPIEQKTHRLLQRWPSWISKWWPCPRLVTAVASATSCAVSCEPAAMIP